MRIGRRSEAERFQEAYAYLRAELKRAGVLGDKKPPRGVCITQPHCDLKEIRFTAWMVSFVITDTYGYDFLWSTDSDTRVTNETIKTAARVVAAEPEAGAGSAYVQLHNAGASTFARMASMAWALDTYLNRASIGALGTSECLHGPSSLFRMTALREVAVKQYLFQYFRQTDNCVSIFCRGSPQSLMRARSSTKTFRRLCF